MEFKGTKGEWQIFDFKGKGPCIDIALDDKSGAIAQVYSPTEIEFNENQTEEHKANAKLIAAAPDMLNALQYVKNCLDVKEGNLCFEFTVDELNTKVKSAINKALGKEK